MPNQTSYDECIESAAIAWKAAHEAPEGAIREDYLKLARMWEELAHALRSNGLTGMTTPPRS